MGLPIWNYSDEKKAEKQTKDGVKPDPTSTSRSSIRRLSRGSHAPTASTRMTSAIPARTVYDAIAGDSVAWYTPQDRLHLPPVPELAPGPDDALNTVQLRDGTLTIGRNGARFAARRSHQPRGRHERDSATRSARRTRDSHPSESTDQPRADLSRLPVDEADIAPQPSVDRRGRLGNLPTPPLDTSSDPLQRNPDEPPALIAFTLPLSSDNGLGDRRRSVSPGLDVWQVMRTTITPDETLPSTSSSFTSAAAATASFTSNLDDDPPVAHVNAEQGDRNVSFHETMREMGIDVDSDRENSTNDLDNSAARPFGEPSSGTENSGSGSDDDGFASEDQDNESILEDIMGAGNADERQMLAVSLFQIATHTLQGRERTEVMRASRALARSSRPRSEASRLPQSDISEPLSLPQPEPQHFGAEVHARAQEAASRTHDFFRAGSHRAGATEADGRPVRSFAARRSGRSGPPFVSGSGRTAVVSNSPGTRPAARRSAVDRRSSNRHERSSRSTRDAPARGEGRETPWLLARSLSYPEEQGELQ